MGVDSKKAPPLPAPTETDTGTDLATDLSKATEKTSQTLPEDGSPVTIPGKKKKHDRDGESLTRTSHQSQTSLLIEYFEGGKGSQAESRRPSVRVKVTPSSKSRSRSTNEHIQITETKGSRKPSHTKRINLSSKDKNVEIEGDHQSVSSFNSATEESNVSRNNPIEIEVMPKRHGSPLIPTEDSSSREVRIQQLGSDVSSMPADSFLDGKTRSPERKRSRSLTRGEAVAAGAVTGLAAGVIADTLHTPSRRRSRSLSRERIVAQKVAEKVKGDKAERRRKHSSGSRSRSVSNSEKHTETIKSPRRRSSRSHGDESIVSGADMSQVTGSRLSVDQRSFRSGTSKSSINNPKLLETVEDAIRRLILPELTALKKEQKANANRDKFERERRGSITSGSTGISRDSRDELSSTRRVSNRSSAPNVSTKPRVTIDGREVIAGDPAKIRKERHDSPRSFEREASEETVIRDENRVRNKKSSEKRTGLGALAAGLGLGALTATALQNHSRENLDERQERRRRRTKSRSQSGSLAESYEESEHHQIHPPMPMMSDINASEVTRSSILSADTERPNPASAERLMTPVREVQRGYASPSRTPTRSPMTPHQSTPTERGNRSYGELSRESLRNREVQEEQEEYELDEHGRKVPMRESYEPTHEDDYQEEDENHSHALEASALGAAAGGLMGAAIRHQDRSLDHSQQEEETEYYQPGEVPPPLRYVPYNAQKRGLSPIQSVSGYTEDEGAGYHQTRNSGLTRSTGSYSTMNQSPQHQKSIKSVDSDQSALRGNRHDFSEVRQGGLADSELTQDGDYWEEQHRENDRNRDVDTESFRDYKRKTNYTDESVDAPYDERVSAGQSVRGIGANPDYVHTPMAVESAVASLVSASVLTGGSGHSGLDRRDSYASYDNDSERNFTSRGNSPRKYDEQLRDLGYSGSERQLTSDGNSPQKYEDQTRDLHYSGSDREIASQQNSPTKSPQYAEYEVNDQGRKVTMQNHHTDGNATAAPLIGAVADGSAAAIVNQHHEDIEPPGHKYGERREESGARLHKSFKDRAMDLEPRSPRHSIDRLITEEDGTEDLKPTANFIPDIHDPMPEIGYGDQMSEPDSNHSYVKSPLGGREYGNRDHWPNLETPKQPKLDTAAAARSQDRNSPVKVAENGLGLVDLAATAGTTANLVNHEREASHDHDEQWPRTSEERKRDTLITNPYEGTSPITLLGGLQDRNLLGRMGYDGVDHGYAAGSPGALPKDEGYISAANARSPGAATPERRPKGVGFMDDVGIGAAASAFADEDPFYTPKHARHLSGMSHGMESPLYDSATGNGIDRIQSKDIVALMDHLTVRDAQRSARDTEILVTLVRAAAEMRNSFEDMKRLLADTEDAIITETQRNTERSVQKVINGPRPPPPSVSRSRGSQDGTVDDLPSKKRNVFRRALKGLSMRSSNDLNKIEDMLVQLLSEVEGLKIAQGLPGRSNPSDTFDVMQQEDTYEQDRGYEPEGNAGTSTASHASQSGHFSNPLSRGASASRGFDGRKFSENRISTVPEGDEEELDIHEQAVLANQFEHNEELLTPTREAIRGGSAPLDSPPQQYVAPLSISNENTPKTEKSKKHKSSSSSGWIPRISRWSETTASTVARGFRSSGRRDTETTFDPQPQSRSGSDLGNYENSPHNPYSEDKLHSRFSQDDIRQPGFDENNPQLASLLPPEDPKYKAHRNSLNLQHPQPRPGPTHRYQTALESQAQDFSSPTSPKSVDFESSTSVNRLPPNPNANRYSTGTNGTDQLSPVSDGGYGSVPARPPKEPLSSSSGPEIPPKIRNRLTKPSPLSKEHLNVESIEDDKRVSYGTVSTAANQTYDSPRSSGRVLSANLGVPNRKPTGPRSMGEKSRSGNLSPAEVSSGEGKTARQKKRDTFGTIASNHSVESETF